MSIRRRTGLIKKVKFLLIKDSRGLKHFQTNPDWLEDLTKRKLQSGL